LHSLSSFISVLKSFSPSLKLNNVIIVLHQQMLYLIIKNLLFIFPDFKNKSMM